LQGFKALFEDLPHPYPDLRIYGTDRTGIIIIQVLESRSGFYPAMGFAAFLIIHVPADGADVPGRVPFLKSPLADPAFPLLATDRADIGLGEIIKFRSFRNTIVWFTAKG
jgi:hypothetical protein